MNIRDWTIRTRLRFAFILIGLFLCVLGGMNLRAMGQLRQVTIDLEENTIPSLSLLSELKFEVALLRVGTLRYLQDRSAESRASERRDVEKVFEDFNASKAAYIPLISLPGEQQEFQKLDQDFSQYKQVVTRVFELVDQQQLDEANRLQQEDMGIIVGKMNTSLAQLSQLNREFANRSSKESAADYQQISWLMGLLVVLALLFALVLAVLITRSIAKPLSGAVRIASDIANKDLTTQVDAQGKDELTELLIAIRTMQANLRQTLHQVTGSAGQLSSASRELSAVTERNANALTQQTDQVQQAAAAVTQMSAAIDEVANMAAQASHASTQSAQGAEQGRNQVQQTISRLQHMNQDIIASTAAVQQLADQSGQIVSIVDVIRAIAEQTNLLALNAAIEAARAGDAGRGFAVVADEVRALAARTQKSTQEIEQMVQKMLAGASSAMNSMTGSNAQAQQALEVANLAGAALDQIFEQVNRINDSNMVIASAAEQQSKVAREVDRNIIAISDIAVQSAQSANKNLASAHQLSQLAGELTQLASQFRT